MTTYERDQFNHPPPPGRIGWVTLSDFKTHEHNIYEQHRFCEAPRHAGSFTSAEFVFMCFDFHENVYVQGMCRECMTMLASDMDLDADTDAIPFRV